MYNYIKQNPVTGIMRNFPTEILVQVVQALYYGGLRSLEIASNTPDALKQIEMLRKHLPSDFSIGAGTVLNDQMAKEAISAGATFLLTPSTNESTLEYCANNNILLLPGVLTPTDVSICCSYGFETLKLFPADSLPLNYIKGLKGPFQNTNYVAVGGVTRSNAIDFFKNGYIGVGIGNNLIDFNAIDSGDWDKITQDTKTLLNQIKSIQS